MSAKCLVAESKKSRKGVIKMAKRSSAHKTAQKRGKIRDLLTCQICGSKDKAEGHHIFDVFFAGSTLVDNIITLCKGHHKMAHNNKIDIVKF
jgi:5-methylcytosine-specific restriction endonuclease McrA